jgi:hypothetical protein
MLVAGLDPNVTVLAPLKPLPEIVTSVAPPRGPLCGDNALTTGAAT